MKEFKYVIQDTQGIHARPAGILVKAAGGFKSDIQLDKDGRKGDLKRIFGVMDEWMKSETPVEEGGMEDMYTVAGDGKDMTLAEETEKIGDKEVYVLTSTISGEEFQQILGSMEEMTESIGEVDFSTMQAEVTMKIYKDTVLPASVSIEMSDSGEGFESEGVLIKFNSISVVMNYNEFDSIDSITIPEEALSAPSADEGSILNEEALLETEAAETEAAQ